LSAASALLFAHALPSGSQTLSASWRLARLLFPGNTSSIGYAGLKQLGDRSFDIHPPLQSFESIALRLSPLIMQCWRKGKPEGFLRFRQFSGCLAG
jgi:hypothetical protein